MGKMSVPWSWTGELARCWAYAGREQRYYAIFASYPNLGQDP